MAPKGERREKMLADAARFFGDQTALREAQEAIDAFNSRLLAGIHIWSYPTVEAALLTKHHWLIVACDSCGLTLDLDLRMKPRHPETSIRAALKDVRCPRCKDRCAQLGQTITVEAKNKKDGASIAEQIRARTHKSGSVSAAR